MSFKCNLHETLDQFYYAIFQAKLKIYLVENLNSNIIILTLY